MKFRYTILYVEDVPLMLAFYETAFGLSRRFLHEGGDYGELDTGATRLAFSSLSLMRSLGKDPATPPVKQPAFEIAFETDDVAAALEQALGAGAVLVQKATEMPWGQTVAYLRDPTGTLVEICTPVQTP